MHRRIPGDDPPRWDEYSRLLEPGAQTGPLQGHTRVRIRPLPQRPRRQWHMSRQDMIIHVGALLAAVALLLAIFWPHR
jgi:hypothetical protein